MSRSGKLGSVDNKVLHTTSGLDSEECLVMKYCHLFVQDLYAMQLNQQFPISEVDKVSFCTFAVRPCRSR